MSFTSTVKNEVSKLDVMETERIAILSAILINSEFSKEKIRISTENASVARLVFSLIKDLFNEYAKITVRQGYNYNKNLIYILEVNNNIEKILMSLALLKDGKILDVPQDYIVDDMDSMRAYLRGLFIICGSINDPKKSRYHLEFLVEKEDYAKFIVKSLNEFYLNSKYIKRDNKYMIYIKEAEKIGDFLRIMNATSALLYYEDIRIYRDHKNMTNRLNNMEQANVDKSIETAARQVKEIEKIQSIGGLDLLDEKVREVAIYRLKYPEVSLVELSEIISYETGKVITKSGLYHRFKKISELANKIK